jgi:hypothetical protein
LQGGALRRGKRRPGRHRHAKDQEQRQSRDHVRASAARC